ncbi:hypothetical protein ED208_15005 [Stagnimonas aquatica]|uniref:DUF3300 domain-containing protein n=1 Tax=Stagnimonas aquatica TaxID=2689987 RepID=A0A3N0V2I1_9GAMM|nr:hypothetical protein [Stagnimonas aquatica]ROH86741.1 hypothetical protein ED208_15005 [Stagnimonas aquatica]
MNKTNLLAASLLALPTLALAQIGVSISLGDPGFYGRVDIGDYPPPRLLYAKPILVEPVRVSAAPIYLRVPPGQARQWARHCREYDACGRPVYFLQDDWYQQVYVPAYRSRHHGGPGDHGRHGEGKGHDRH